MNGEIST